MSVRLIDFDQDRDRQAWDHFVHDHPDGSPFHSSAWMRALTVGFGHQVFGVMVEQDQQVVGLFPLSMIRSRLFGNRLISNAFAVQAGDLAQDAQIRRIMDDAAKNLCTKHRLSWIEVRAHKHHRRDWMTRSDDYSVFEAPIAADRDAVLKAIPRKQRAEVRRSLTYGLQMRITQDVEAFRKLYARSLHRLGTPLFPRKWFEALQHFFGPLLEMAVVMDAEERVVASLLSLYHGQTVYPYYVGGNDRTRALRAHDFLYFNQMNHARDHHSCTRFSFGRSKIGTGAWHFKKNWGFQPQQFHVEYWSPSEEKLEVLNPLSPKYRMKAHLWSKMPAIIADNLGPLISPGLG